MRRIGLRTSVLPCVRGRGRHRHGLARACACAIAAAHSPTLSAAERKEVATIFNGKGSGLHKGKIVVTADKIDCRISNVDIASRSCELTFGGKTQSLTGREANELYATEVFAGVPSDGAAGSIHEAVAKLKCTLDPNAIKQNDGSGAD